MKRAFTLLELVLAIIVLSLALMAVPRIILQSQSSNIYALKQELIYHAKSQALIFMRYPWDSAAYYLNCQDNPEENRTVGECARTNNMLLPIYKIAPQGEGGDASRPGIIRNDFVTRYESLRPDITYSATKKADFTNVSWGVSEKNDIDDFDGTTYRVYRSEDNFDFVTDVDINSSVDFINDKATGGYKSATSISIDFTNDTNTSFPSPTNIKRVNIKVSDRDHIAKDIVMSLFSFNYGDSPEIVTLH
ncbi:type II secretion system protein [uncultured Campylobacter sp.]|uniref:pilus assembly FimT family protein n=1 Tax=uncultured Campylobacter sp. TaxID=218934 RepID=UPI0026145DC4|nr:type II secretion system protein [uncultured Campylobacter sp.]